jgi:glycosyltransferase involved in cell wall biosynthesis
MAIGRAIVTTDAPGCRETVRRSAAAPSDRRTDAPASVTKGENGFLVPVRDAESLAWAMKQFILDDELAVSMGRASRQYAEDRYDVHKVNAVILQALGIARGLNASSGIR